MVVMRMLMLFFKDVEETLFQRRDIKGKKALIGLTFLGCLIEHSENKIISQSGLFENEVKSNLVFEIRDNFIFGMFYWNVHRVLQSSI